MCDKQESLRLEVGKTYVDACGRIVKILHIGHGPRPCLGIIDAGTLDECSGWYAVDGSYTLNKYHIVREKRPTKTFRCKRYLFAHKYSDHMIGLYHEHGIKPCSLAFVKWIDEDWQTVEVELP